MDERNIKLDISGQIATVTISRPEQLNALNLKMLEELSGCLYEINGHEDIRCVIITGEGEKAFAAGADTKVMESYNSFDGAVFSQKGNDVFLKLQHMPMPVIAVVNGYALGGGLELALSCDIRLAHETAVFGMPEVTLGIMPGWGGTQRLQRAVGYSKAAELIFTGKRISAREALQLGIISEIYPAGELMNRAYELAQVISANAPLGIRNAKKSMNLGAQMDIGTAVGTEAQYFGMLFSSEDRQEGLSAFRDRKKQPQYKNR